MITDVKYLTCSKCGESYQITYDRQGNTNNWWLQAYSTCNRCFNEYYFADWKEKSKNNEWGKGPKPIDVQFKKENKVIHTGSNENLRQCAIGAGINVYKHIWQFLNCQGNGHCGTCMIRVEDQSMLNPPTETEKKLLKKKLDQKIRLACQCTAKDNVEITTLVDE